MSNSKQTLLEIKKELVEAHKQIKELNRLYEVHLEYHKQQSQRLVNLEDRVVALIKWMEPEGFTVSKKPTHKA